MIICNVRGARQMLPDPDWKAEAQRGARARTNAGNNNDNDNQGGHMTSWMSKRSPTERKLRIDTRRRSQPSSRKNDNSVTQDVRVQEDKLEGKCVAGPVLTRVQANKIHPLNVKEAMSMSTSLP